jgi:hypothetical protein
VGLDFNLDIKSNSLEINLFDNKWSSIPQHEKENHVIGDIYFDTHYIKDDIKIGIFRQKNIDISMNSGFIQTLYYSSNDFSTLLNSNNIGSEITSKNIEANANYFDTKGMYIEKKFDLDSKHTIKTKFKLYKAKDIQYLNLQGSNDNRFLMSFDYYYSKTNKISKNNNHDNNYSGQGYGLDLEYIYKNNDLYFNFGIFNINSYINWKSITHMYYDFDSQTVYKGDDGFNHIKPFGVGYYKYNIDYKQKIPIKYKVILDYKIDNSISIGDNIDFDKNIMFNEIYIQKEYINNLNTKIGYIYELQNIIFGLKYKTYSIEISNDIKTSNRVIRVGFKVDL